jgi:hypothetical protein
MEEGRGVTSASVSLLLSLLFGVGQVVVGGGAALRIWRAGTWRSPATYILLLIGLWFVGSGVAELAVSGMEVARNVTGHPSAAAFDLWRGRIDAGLVAVTVALLVCLAAYLAWKAATRRQSRAGQSGQ